MKGTLEAITMTRKKLEGKVPLLGFAGAPVSQLGKNILCICGSSDNDTNLFAVDSFELHDRGWWQPNSDQV